MLKVAFLLIFISLRFEFLDNCHHHQYHRHYHHCFYHTIKLIMLSSVPEEDQSSTCSLSPVRAQSPEHEFSMCFISTSAPASFVSSADLGSDTALPGSSCSHDHFNRPPQCAVAARSVSCQVRSTSIAMETSVLRPVNRVRFNRINLSQLAGRLHFKRPRLRSVHVQHPAVNVNGDLFSWVPPSLNDEQVSQVTHNLSFYWSNKWIKFASPFHFISIRLNDYFFALFCFFDVLGIHTLCRHLISQRVRVSHKTVLANALCWSWQVPSCLSSRRLGRFGAKVAKIKLHFRCAYATLILRSSEELPPSWNWLIFFSPFFASLLLSHWFDRLIDFERLTVFRIFLDQFPFDFSPTVHHSGFAW